jgi:DNA-binding phage protein
MAEVTTRFDAADYLNTEERRLAYLAAARESDDANFVLDALHLIARARRKSPENMAPTTFH